MQVFSPELVISTLSYNCASSDVIQNALIFNTKYNICNLLVKIPPLFCHLFYDFFIEFCFSISGNHTGYDHLYRIQLQFIFTAWKLRTPFRWRQINLNEHAFVSMDIVCTTFVTSYPPTLQFTLLIYSLTLSGHWQINQR
jgi:hypothetical protein